MGGLARGGQDWATTMRIQDLDRSVPDRSAAISLPPACYTSPAFYEFELDAIFSREWLCLGRAEQVPNVGDYFTITIVDEPLIVVRSSDTEIKVLSAVCQHRGMLVADGAGNCGNAFRCPYHWWSYRLDGQLISGPEMGDSERFDRRAIRLPELRCEVWEGFVFANFDSEAAPVRLGTEKLDQALANYRPAELRTTEPDVVEGLPFNWKVMMENGIEAYHASRLHSRYVGYQPSKNYEPVAFDDGDRAILAPVRNLHIDGGLNPTFRILFPPIPTLTEEDRFHTTFATMPPNLMLGWQADLIFWFLILPRAVDRIDLQWAYLLHPSVFDDERFEDLLEMTKQGVEKFNEQDLPVAEAIQRGLSSRFAPRGAYSWQEEMLVQVNRWLVQRYRRALLASGSRHETGVQE